MTKSDYSFDDQALGSFVDDLLDAAHNEEIIKAMENDAEIRERVYQFRRAKDLMRLGFANTRTPSSNTVKSKSRTWKFFSLEIAASFAVIAFAAGMLGHSPYYEPITGAIGQAVASVSQHEPEKLILHISESDPDKFSTALSYTKKFLQEHQEKGHQIEVVAHAGGIDLMRSDVSPLREQILEMMANNENVHFIGCANAIKMLRKKGIEPDIITGVSTDSTAFDHIVGRLQAGGWKYMKVESIKEI